MFECLNVPEKLKPFANDYKINVCEVAHISKEQAAKFKSDFRIVAEFFASLKLGETWRGSCSDLVHIGEVLELLSAFTPSENEEDFLAFVDEGGDKMYGILEKIRQEGRQSGLLEGRKKTLDSAKYLFSSGVDIEQLCAAFHLTDEEHSFVVEKSAR